MVETLYDAATFHQLALAAEGRSKRTLAQYKTYEVWFLSYVEQAGLPTTLDTLSVDVVRDACRWLIEQPHKGGRNGASVLAAFVRTMKVWSHLLETEGYVPDDPLRRLKRVRDPDVDRPPFTRTEILALIEATTRSRQTIRDRALLLLLLDTGIRIEEACTLTTERLNLPERQITVIGKGSKIRTVPFGDPLLPDGGRTVRAVRAYLNERERLFHQYPRRRTTTLFLSRTGYALSTDSARDLFARLGGTASVPNVIPHRFRATFATLYLVQYPGDEYGLRRLLGHVSQRVLARYVHFSQLILAERHGRGSPVSQWLGRASPAHDERPRTLARLQAETSAEDAVPQERRTQRTTRRPRVNPVSAPPLPAASVADVAAAEDVVRKPADHLAPPPTDLADQIRTMQANLAALLRQMEQTDA